MGEAVYYEQGTPAMNTHVFWCRCEVEVSLVHMPTEDKLSPWLTNLSIRPMAPMSSHWLQSLSSPQMLEVAIDAFPVADAKSRYHWCT